MEDGDAITGSTGGSDEDGDALTYAVASDGTYGSLTVADDGTWTYSVDNSNDAVQALAEGATLTDTATITVSDAEDSVEATVTITITGANDHPTGSDGAGAVTAGTDMAAMGDVMAADVDEGDTHTFAVGTQGMYGELSVDEAGAWTYMLNHDNEAVMALAEGETMEDTATITITDDKGGSVEVSVTITITGVDDAPSAPTLDATEGALTVAENNTDGANIGTLSSHDPEGDDITYSLDSAYFEIETVGGTVILKYADGMGIDFESLEDGTVTVMVTATDMNGNASEATAITVTVTNVNEPPTLSVMNSETPDGMPAVSTIVENMTGPVGEVRASDPEQTITADDITVSDSRFSLMTDDFGGIWLMLNEGLDADVEGGGSVTVMLTATDAGGLTSETEAVITVININEAPTIEVVPGVVPAADGGRGASGALDENDTGPAYEIIISDAEDDLTADNVTIDDARFEVKVDSEGGLWAFLKDEVNFEGADRMNGTADDISSIDILVTVTDSGGASSMSMVTVTINDVNDAPHALQEGVWLVDDADTKNVDESAEAKSSFDATAGEDFQLELDLDRMFADEDGNTVFRYTLEGTPSWLKVLNVQYGDDGEVVGMTLEAAPPPGDVGEATVMVVATDEGGASGHATFDIVIDDGNDVPTAIHLFNQDDNTRNDFFDLEVDEGEQGTLLGYLTVEDQDDPRHSHGQHTWTVDNDNFEIVEVDGRQTLKLTDGAEIDFEAGASITLTVTVTDGDGASLAQRVDVDVNDMNDPVVVANEPGNWWVTIDEDTDPETVGKGAYLTFDLEVEGDALPLFTDSDESGDNATLAYTMSGPDWLEIDAMTGRITNKAGAEDDELPEGGVYDITVTATDGGGSSAQASFKLAVAVSGADDADNDQPDIGSRQEMDIAEDSGAGTPVATFTVTDEDLNLEGIHPWSQVTVRVEPGSIMGTPTAGGSAELVPDGALDLQELSRDSESITYNVVLTAAGAMAVDYETYDEITFNVRAFDGTADPAALTDQNSDLVEFDFEITDVDEEPAVSRDTGTHSSANLGETNMPAVAVMQSEADTITLYINLSNYFEDPDEDDDDDELTYSISEDTPWITIVANAGEWRDVQEGPDGDDGTMDDVTWDTDLTEPDDRDYVAVLTIDRTGMTNAQDVDGSFTITVTDESGMSHKQVVMVSITDQNLDVAADAEGVELNDDTPHQNDRLTMQFDRSVDPDFTGEEARTPIVTLYEWKTDTDEDADNGDETLVSVSADNPAHLMVTQDHVGLVIQGSVVYFELGPADTAGDPVRIHMSEGGAGLEDRSALVADRPDAATGTITFNSTNAEQELVATIAIMDPDGMDPDATDSQATAPKYTWQASVNGTGGWTMFDDNDTTDGSATEQTTTTMNLPNGHSHVRLVVTFDDQNGTPERIVSEVIEVGTIATLDPVPAIAGFGTETNPAVGRTLEVMVDDNDEVEWIANQMVIGTGKEFTLTRAHAAASITARITTKDADGKVTSIVTTDAVTVAGTAPTNTQAIAVDADIVLLGKAPAMNGTLMEYRTTIDADSLFEDIEGGLTFTFSSTDAGDDEYPDQPLDVSLNNDGDQLLIIDETTGEVRYYTTKANNHGNSTGDGAGNVVTITVTAADGTNTAVTNTVDLAIDVPGAAPVGLNLATTVTENAATTANTNVGTIDIQDNNAPTNVYGQYDWTISDDRFTITPNSADSSEATIGLKANQMFDIDPDTGTQATGANGMLMVTITATPKKGSEFHDTPITMTMTVTIEDDTNDNPEEAPDLSNNVPGLKDNETGDTNDEEDGTDDPDDDEDGGTQPLEDEMASMVSMLDDGILF